MIVRAILVVAAVFMTAATAVAQTQPHAHSHAQAHGASDADAIRHLMKATWEKPAEAISVPHVVVASDYAIAGWTQGEMGGRALLRKKAEAWSIILCAGDQLRDVETLRKAGIADATARHLAAELAKSESKLPQKDIAMFSRFEGLVTIDSNSSHPHSH